MGRFRQCRQEHVKECIGEMESLFIYKLKSVQPTKPARKNFLNIVYKHIFRE